VAQALVPAASRLIGTLFSGPVTDIFQECRPVFGAAGFQPAGRFSIGPLSTPHGPA